MHDDWDSADVDFARVLTAAASSSTRVVTAQVAASGTESNVDGETERGDAVEVLQPLGLMAVPAVTSTTQAPFLRMGDQMVGLAIIDKGAPAQAVEAGEARLYGPGSGNSTANVRVRNSGAVEVNAKANSNVALNVDGTGDVVLDGGSLKVARVTDAVTAGATMTTWIAAVTTFVNGIAPGTAVLPTDFGTIATSGGATHVKA